MISHRWRHQNRGSWIIRRFTSSAGTWAAALVTRLPIRFVLLCFTGSFLGYHLERELVSEGVCPRSASRAERSWLHRRRCSPVDRSIPSSPALTRLCLNWYLADCLSRHTRGGWTTCLLPISPPHSKMPSCSQPNGIGGRPIPR